MRHQKRLHHPTENPILKETAQELVLDVPDVGLFEVRIKVVDDILCRDLAESNVAHLPAEMQQHGFGLLECDLRIALAG